MTNARTARERAAAMRQQEQEKARKRQRLVVIGVVVGLVVVVGGIIGGVLLFGRNKTGPTATPAGVTNGSGPIPVGTGKVTVDLYEDFQCPSCGEFQKVSGPTIAQLEADKKVTTNYYLVSFLGEESVRAANAAGCAQDQGKFIPFYNYLFAHQPAEHTGGYPTEELIKAGAAVGITNPAFGQCVTSTKYQTWVTNVNTTAFDGKIQGTPTVFVNGQQLQNPTPDAIKQAVASASGQ